MNASNLAALSLRTLAIRRGTHLTTVWAVALATGTTFVALSLALGLRQIGGPRLLGDLPITRLVVTARQADVLFLRLQPSLLVVDSTSLAALHRIKGVTAVWPEYALAAPASLVANLLGTSFSTDCAVYGVPPGFFPPSERPLGFVPPAPGEPVPVVLSPQLIEL